MNTHNIELAHPVSQPVNYCSPHNSGNKKSYALSFTHASYAPGPCSSIHDILDCGNSNKESIVRYVDLPKGLSISANERQHC